MSHNIIHKIKRGSFIEYSLNGINRKSFDILKKELKSVLKKRMGIYALYKGDKVVRVGLGTEIYYRVKGHSENKNLDWDNASLFLIRKEYIGLLRDLETAVVRIAKPKYNKQKGRIGDEHFLERILKKSVNQKQKKLRTARMEKDEELKGLEQEIKSIKEVIK
jgi:hypothetical protein